MQKKDVFFILFVVLFFLPFFISNDLYNLYNDFNNHHGFIMSFVKFAILSTLGEVIGFRIQTGNYYSKTFGIIPRAIVWGFLGLWIKMSFVIFSSGVPSFLTYMGINEAKTIFQGDLSLAKVAIALCVSACMNTSFAPVFMTIHKITDAHIINNNGSLKCFLRPINITEIISNLNWKVQWNFVFKKTIPLFWIPAHCLTFCLPENYQVLFAAFLGVILGVLLSIAAIKGKK